jgi:hypothetical protein
MCPAGAHPARAEPGCKRLDVVAFFVFLTVLKENLK